MKTITFNEILATRARATFSYRINFDRVSLATLEQMDQWCEANCQGSWHSETEYALYWRFTEERDAVMFKLRWATADGNQLR
jgi:nuclear transport factor 2 (NTF2) superfamily protein